MKHEPNIAVHYTKARGYNKCVPHDPSEPFPEYASKGIQPDNPVYGDVREILRLAGLDQEHFGSPQWNPFGKIIQPGMTVFIKPNTVSHVNLAGHDLLSVILHASVLRPILDYVCLALKGKGRVVIGDSQVIFAEFEPAMKRSGITDLLAWYRPRTSVPIECFDLRIVRGTRSWMYGRWARTNVSHDPQGYQSIDLGRESYFEGIDPARLRIAIASHKTMVKYHSEGRHQYVFPRSFLQSDVVINLAKLKTHRRTAITLALKNFMGIPALKDCLPHFITGAFSEGGDQYIHPCRRKELCLRLHDIIQTVPSIPTKFACAILKKLIWGTRFLLPFPDDIYEAMWAGNDTLWRTLLDLNRIVAYADKEGVLRDTPQRTQFHLIDGIMGGQGDGPLATEPVNSRVLLAGSNAACLDAVGATLMGFDPTRIPLISKAFQDASHARPICSCNLEDLQINLDGVIQGLDQFRIANNLHFAPHPKWIGHIEYSPEPSTRPQSDPLVSGEPDLASF